MSELPIHKKFKHKTQEWLSFTREWFKNPGAVGAVCPSSKQLAQTIAHCIAPLPVMNPRHPQAQDKGLIVELGPGTGCVTKALLDAGFPASHLRLIERGSRFVSALKRDFPDLWIIEGDAQHVHRLLAEEAAWIHAVVSSLPLRSLPQQMVQHIGEALNSMCPTGSQFIQYSYGHGPCPLEAYMPRAQLTSSRWVFANLPPARVSVYTFH